MTKSYHNSREPLLKNNKMKLDKSPNMIGGPVSVIVQTSCQHVAGAYSPCTLLATIVDVHYDTGIVLRHNAACTHARSHPQQPAFLPGLA